MSKEDKYNEIIKRAKAEEVTQDDLIVFMVLGYLEKLTDKGLIEGGEWKTTKKGKFLISLCEEFDFKPSDSDIILVMEGLGLIEDKSKMSIFKFLCLERDKLF